MKPTLPENILRPLHMLYLSRSGPGLTIEEINYVAESRVPGERDWIGTALTSAMTVQMHPVVGPPASEYLIASGLIAKSGSSDLWRITDQGAALVQGFMRQQDDVPPVFILDPDAPLDYHGLLNELTFLDNPLVVDAYFHPHDFNLLTVGLPGSTLITVSRAVARVEKFKKPALNIPLKKSAFEEALAAQSDEQPKSKVVYVPTEKMHDRYFLGSNAVGYLVGGSFRSSKITVAMKIEGQQASELYETYRSLATGADAQELAPKRGLVGSPQTGSDAGPSVSAP